MLAQDPDVLDSLTLRAMLEWQMELGATEAMGDVPVDRFAEAALEAERRAAERAAAAEQAGPERRRKPPPIPEAAPAIDVVAEAEAMVAGVADLEGLAAALEAFEHCELKKGARNFVFSDGNPAARVMIIGEAPGRDEDLAGKPFVGRAGQLLDRMFAAIGLAREASDAGRALYICNVLPWRPPANRTPDAAEIAMMRPFLRAHVQLADPDVVVVMGNTPCAALLGRTGILGLRGQWQSAWDRPVMPMTHPAYLLRTPIAKREAWADLLAIRAKLGG